MFKKPFSINLNNKVSGADRKKLRRGLENAFEGLSAEELDALLPSKAGDLEALKLPAPSRTVIYTLDKNPPPNRETRAKPRPKKAEAPTAEQGKRPPRARQRQRKREPVPIIVDSSGKGDLFPTIFALWRAPNMLPKVNVKHPFVTQYLVNGADLMLPGADVTGVAEAVAEFQKRDMVSVCVPGNPAPLAIGVAGMSLAQAREKAAAGLKGKLVEVVQNYGDYLWSDIGGRAVPNVGYVSNGVVPLGTAADVLLDGDDDEEEEEGGSTKQAGTADSAGGRVGTELVSQLGAMAVSTSARGAAPNTGEEEEEADEKLETAVDMDELLQTSLLQALHRSVKEDMLPLNSSQLWNGHVLPSRPFGSTLGIPTPAAMWAYAGKGGLLSIKEERHSGDVMLTGINRSHEMYTEYRPYALNKSAGAAESAAASSTAASSSNPCSTELYIEELYKPGKELKPVFEALNIPHDVLMMDKDIGEVGFAYVKAANLADGGLVKKGEPFPTHMPKADIREAMLKRSQPQVRISRAGQQVIKKGAVPKISVSSAKRQGHKITVITGTEPFLVDPADLSAECQKKFACATTVTELPGKHQGSEVVIQGTVLEKVADFLTKKYGIPKHYIDVKKTPQWSSQTGDWRATATLYCNSALCVLADLVRHGFFINLVQGCDRGRYAGKDHTG
eukprot:gene17427-23728_t